MEFAPFVSLRPSGGALTLAGAELSEVLGGLGDDVFEELESYATEGFAYTFLSVLFLMSLTFVMLGESERRNADGAEKRNVPPRVMSKKTL